MRPTTTTALTRPRCAISGHLPCQHFRAGGLDHLPVEIAALDDGHEAPLRISPALADPRHRERELERLGARHELVAGRVSNWRSLSG
jgi:hypothetical protein